MVGYLKMKSSDTFTMHKVPSYTYKAKDSQFYSVPDFNSDNYKLAQFTAEKKYEYGTEDERIERLKKMAKKMYGD